MLFAVQESKSATPDYRVTLYMAGGDGDYHLALISGQDVDPNLLSSVPPLFNISCMYALSPSMTSQGRGCTMHLHVSLRCPQPASAPATMPSFT